MPGKHVRFEDIPPTPPSTYSQLSSLPPSEGPITPQHSYPFTPLPCHIHAALSPSHALSTHYDLSLPSKYRQLQSSLPQRVLAESATSPPLPSMTITCQNLPWAVRVAASGNSKQGPFVTVQDVLDAVHRSMRVSVTKAEFDKVKSIDVRWRIEETCRRRCMKINDPSAYQQETSGGIRRVDFLMGKTTFAGLLSSRQDAERWELNVS